MKIHTHFLTDDKKFFKERRLVVLPLNIQHIQKLFFVDFSAAEVDDHVFVVMVLCKEFLNIIHRVTV